MFPSRRAFWLLLSAPAAGLIAVVIAGGSTAPVAGAAGAATKTVTVVVTDAVFDANPNVSTWGTVTSDPPGITCPGDCSEDFPRGTTVQLTLARTEGYALARWSVFDNNPAPDCDAADVCSLTVADDGLAVTTVEAAMQPEAQLVAIPQGAGKLTIDPVEEGRPAVDCTTEIPVFDPVPIVCAPRYVNGTQVTVTAVADEAVPGAHFVRWSDYRCPPTPSCTLKVVNKRYLTAIFSPLYLTVAPGSFGPVTLTPPGRPCTFEAECQFPYPLGDDVTLSRDPANAQNATDEWTGSCSGGGETCTVTMRRDEYIRAGTEPGLDVPTRVPENILLQHGGTKKGGKITLIPRSGTGPSRTCPKTCRADGYRLGDSVLLKAKRTRRAKFVRWADNGLRRPSRAVMIGYTQAVKAVFARR